MEHFEFNWRTGDGLQIYAQGWRPEGDPGALVCLVHGLGEHSGRYAHLARRLTGEGFALLSFDLRGFGKSQGRRGHTPGYDWLMDDVGRLLEEAEGKFPGRQRFLYGHSMGGNLVINYALRRRPRLAGVIASGPWIRLAFDPPAFRLKLGRVMNSLWPTYTQASGLDAAALSRDPEVVRAYNSDPLVHRLFSARLFTSVFEAGIWALDHAAEFELPLLIMHGGSDRLTSPEASRLFAGRVPGPCAFKLWEGFFHEIHNEPEKEDVFNYLVAWLKGEKSL